MEKTELELVNEFQKYLDFHKENPDVNEYSFMNKHPKALDELWFFFCGNLDRIEKYTELHDLYEALYEACEKYRD